ncbi:MAG: hypothetical protein ACI80V_003012 [Rhodothermales bacterium]|jgi:hypothetical protein
MMTRSVSPSAFWIEMDPLMLLPPGMRLEMVTSVTAGRVSEKFGADRLMLLSDVRILVERYYEQLLLHTEESVRVSDWRVRWDQFM